jgi:hypothetical protein
LTTSDQARAALGRDWGSCDAAFTAMSEGVRARLAALAGVAQAHAAVPVQGSGAFAVEAAIQMSRTRYRAGRAMRPAPNHVVGHCGPSSQFLHHIDQLSRQQRIDRAVRVVWCNRFVIAGQSAGETRHAVQPS